MKDIDNQNAIVQKVHLVEFKNLMIEMDIINDNIPFNTYYKIGNLEVKCLRSYINDSIIKYTKDHLNISNIIEIKTIYESITSKSIDLVDIKKESYTGVLILLDELINKIPLGIELVFLNENIKCFNSIISIVKEGLEYKPKDVYWHSCIKEIYTIMASNGNQSFIDAL